jgi:hypothetical protein
MTDKINSDDLELTEKELNRIFNGSDKPVIDKIRSNKIVDDDFKNDQVIEKNIKKVTIPIASLTRPVKLTKKKSIPEKKVKKKAPKKEPVKKKNKGGRPVKWTPEKIAAYKAENKRKAEVRAAIKKAGIRSNDHSLSDYQKQQRIKEAVRSKEEIDVILLQKKKKLKGAIGRSFVEILDSKTKCKDHLYSVVRYTQGGLNPVAVCVHCSKMKEFDPVEWNSYLRKHRKEL